MAFGEILRAAREQRALSLSSVAESTHMKVQIIEDLENEDFHRIAAPIYGRGFVKLYAEFLELDPVPLIREFMDLYTGKRAPVLGMRQVETEPDAPSSPEETATPITRTVSDAALQHPKPLPRPSVRPLEPEGGAAAPAPFARDGLREDEDGGIPRKPVLVLEPEEHVSDLADIPDMFAPSAPASKPGASRAAAKKQRSAIFDMGRHLNSRPAPDTETDSADAAQRRQDLANKFMNGIANLKMTVFGKGRAAGALRRNLFIGAAALLLVFVLAGLWFKKPKEAARQATSGPAPRVFEKMTPVPDLYVD